jgi:hypothetical protein
VARLSARNPEFPKLLDAAKRRRELLRALAERREHENLTQTQVAAAMETSQSLVGCPTQKAVRHAARASVSAR